MSTQFRAWVQITVFEMVYLLVQKIDEQTITMRGTQIPRHPESTEAWQEQCWHLTKDEPTLGTKCVVNLAGLWELKTNVQHGILCSVYPHFRKPWHSSQRKIDTIGKQIKRLRSVGRGHWFSYASGCICAYPPQHCAAIRLHRACKGCNAQSHCSSSCMLFSRATSKTNFFLITNASWSCASSKFWT